MEKGLQAAIRLFPLKAQEIRRLAFADGTFRTICVDLAETETALDNLGPNSVQRDLRQAEYRVLIEELTAEIENMLETLIPLLAGRAWER